MIYTRMYIIPTFSCALTSSLSLHRIIILMAARVTIDTHIEFSSMNIVRAAKNLHNLFSSGNIRCLLIQESRILCIDVNMHK